MLFERIESEGLAHYSYLVGDQREAVVIDPRRDREISIFCGSGLRSTLAASYLQREGWDTVQVVLGGTKGWNSTACPLEL